MMRPRRRRHTTRHSAAALALLILTACAGEADPGATSDKAAARDAAPQQAVITPPPPPVNDDPAQILGLNQASLDDLLGAPVRVRRDGAAEIRQYRAGNLCQLDAFLYRDTTGIQVTHVEIRRGVERLDESAARACMRQLLSAQATS